MKLEKGKFYRSRDGRKWECLSCSLAGLYNAVCQNEHGNAVFFTGSGLEQYQKDSRHDLIAEWTEPAPKPVFDPATIPVFRWAAIDGDGRTFTYTDKPTLEKYGWASIGTAFQQIPAPPYTGDWRESLVELPQNQGHKLGRRFWITEYLRKDGTQQFGFTRPNKESWPDDDGARQIELAEIIKEDK